MLQPGYVAVEALLPIACQDDLTVWSNQAQSSREQRVDIIAAHMVGHDAGQQIEGRIVRIEV